MRYNEARYNEQSYQYFSLAEVVTLSDGTVVKDFTKALQDTTFLSDLLTKQVTEKILSETVILTDWESHHRSNKEWFD